MDKEEKLTFWKKLKFSIFDFEKYQDLALEKIIKTIGYIAILVLIFSLIVSGIMTYQVYGACKSIREYIVENIETIDFADNKLNVVSKQMDEKTVIEDEKLNTKIIIMTLNDEEKIEEASSKINELKAKDLSKQIKVDTSNLSLIEDFTRCFASLYMAQMKNRKVLDSDFSFYLRDIDIEYICEDIASLKDLHVVSGPDLLKKRYSNKSFCSFIMFVVFSSILNKNVEDN